MRNNIGEAILIVGILYLFFHFNNFYILFLILLPIATWSYITIDKYARKLNVKEQELKNEKLEYEIKKLKVEIEK